MKNIFYIALYLSLYNQKSKKDKVNFFIFIRYKKKSKEVQEKNTPISLPTPEISVVCNVKHQPLR